MRTYLLVLISLLTGALHGQATFIQHGSIEFERSILTHKQPLPPEQFYKDFLERYPATDNTAFILYFDSDETIYKRVEDPTFGNEWLTGPAKSNMVYTDNRRLLRTSIKNISDKRMTVVDSVQQIRWKMTDEMRNIAGFDCRKAIGRICDSVYVTAFYTDEITVSGGPESFGGLPGMILGLAIPRLHTTWFAKKVSNTPPATKDFQFKQSGTPIDRKQFEKNVAALSKAWTNREAIYIWWAML